MTERSRPWDGTTIGDAIDAPYDAATEWAALFRALLTGAEQDTNKGGVVSGAGTDYAATTPSANVARIAAGIGWNQGTWHQSDANVDIAIPTPATSTRVDRIVLRKSWSAQTVRLTRIAGVEGSGAPALTQTLGVTWDVPLWQVSITTGAVITFTDERPRLGGAPVTTSWTPVILQGVTLTTSNLAAKYMRVGKWVFGNLFAAISSTGTAGQVITVSTPTTITNDGFPHAMGIIMRGSTAHIVVGTWVTNSALSFTEQSGAVGAVGGAITLQSGDSLWLTFSYEGP